MISVVMTDAFRYRVDIEGERNAQFSITMTQQCYLGIARGQFTHEWVLIKLFGVLLKHVGFDQLDSNLDVSELLSQYDWLGDEIATALFSSRS